MGILAMENPVSRKNLRRAGRGGGGGDEGYFLSSLSRGRGAGISPHSIPQ